MKRGVCRRTMLSWLGGMAILPGVPELLAAQVKKPEPAPDKPSQDSTEKASDEGQKKSAEATESAREISVTLSQESFARFLLRREMNTRDCLAAAKEFGFDRIELSSLYVQLEQQAERGDDKPQADAKRETDSKRETDAKPQPIVRDLLQFVEKSGVKPARLLITGEPPLGAPASENDDELVKRRLGWVRVAKELGINELALRISAEGALEYQRNVILESSLRFFEQAQAENESLEFLLENGPGLSSNCKLLREIITGLREKGIKQVSLMLNVAKLRYDPAEAIQDIGEFTGAIVAETNSFETGQQTKIRERAIDYWQYLPLLIKNSRARDITVRFAGMVNVKDGILKSNQLVRDILKAGTASPEGKPTANKTEKSPENRDAGKRPPG